MYHTDEYAKPKASYWIKGIFTVHAHKIENNHLTVFDFCKCALEH